MKIVLVTMMTLAISLGSLVQAQTIIQLRDQATDVFWSPLVNAGPGSTISMAVDWGLGVGRIEGVINPREDALLGKAAFRASSVWDISKTNEMPTIEIASRGQGENFALTFKDNQLRQLCAEDSYFKVEIGAPSVTWKSEKKSLVEATPNNDCARGLGINYADIQEIGFQTESSQAKSFLIEFTELRIVNPNSTLQGE